MQHTNITQYQKCTHNLALSKHPLHVCEQSHRGITKKKKKKNKKIGPNVQSEETKKTEY